MSAPPYMKMFWGDYLKATTHLTGREHGPYLLLIGAMWEAGGKLPNDEILLARYARCTPKEWAAVRDVVLPFFKVVGANLTHKRIKKEMAQYSETVRKRKAAGKIGGSVSNGKTKASSQANAKQKGSKSPHNQNQNQKGRIEAPNRASISSRRDSAAERADGSSALRSIEPGIEPPAPKPSREERAAQVAEMRRAFGLKVVGG